MLPADFQFSQSSLQDFHDCPRRFFLRWIRRVNYPAAQSEPMEMVEAHMQRGADFHALVHRHLIGIPPGDLVDTIDDDELAVWWENYLHSGLTDLPSRRTPEITLSAPVGGYRLIAKYDAVCIEPGTPSAQAVIVDWKTSLRLPKRERLLERLQTLVYRYVLVEAGHELNDSTPIKPENVVMRYWFAAHPDQPLDLTYSAAEHERAGARLTALIEDIHTRSAVGESAFELTTDLRRCDFCQYRSLNDRGTVAGDYFAEDNDALELTDGADDFPPDFTLDQIAEIEF